MIGPIDEGGRYHEGFGWLSRKDAPNVAEEIVDDLERRGFFYHLEAYTHRYPHCWRCETPLLFRLVDEWYISMGPVYDKPRDRADARQRSTRASATRSWRSSTRSGGSRASATSGSSTGS